MSLTLIVLCIMLVLAGISAIRRNAEAVGSAVDAAKKKIWDILYPILLTCTICICTLIAVAEFDIATAWAIGLGIVTFGFDVVLLRIHNNTRFIKTKEDLQAIGGAWLILAVVILFERCDYSVGKTFVMAGAAFGSHIAFIWFCIIVFGYDERKKKA